MLRLARALNFRRATRRPIRSLLAALAVGAGVSLLVAVIIAQNSFSHSIEGASQDLAGLADLRLVGATTRGGLVEDVLGPVEATEGVAAAVPIVQTVTLADPGELPVLVLGVDCRAQSVAGPGACRPAEAPPMVSASLKDRLDQQGGLKPVLRTNRGALDLGAADVTPALDTFNDGRVVVLPLERAQEVFGRPGRFDVVYVAVDDRADLPAVERRLEDAVGPHHGVLGATDPPPGSDVVAGTLLALFSLLALFALGVGAVLIHNTVTLTLEERRRDLAVIGAVGGTGRVIVGGAVLEGVAIGLVGGAIGVAGGAAVSMPVVSGLSEFSRWSLGIGIEQQVGFAAMVWGVGLGVLVAGGASILPAWRATRLDVAAELSLREKREESAAPARLRRAAILAVLGFVGLGMTMLAHQGGSLERWQPPVGFVGLLITILSFLPLSGILAGLLVRSATPLVRDRFGAARLGIDALARDARRTSVLAAAVAAAVGTAVVVASFTESISQAVTDGTLDDTRGRVRVATQPSDVPAPLDARPSPELIATLEAHPAVERVDEVAFVVAGAGSGDTLCIAAVESPAMAFHLYRGSADATAFHEGRAMIGANLARTKGLDPGDEIRLPTPTGHRPVEVLGIWANGNCNGRSIELPLWLLRDLYGPEPASELLVLGRDGVGPEELQEQLYSSEWAPGSERFLSVQTPEQMISSFTDVVARQMAPFWAMQRALLVVALVAILTTFLLSGIQRRREMGVLAAVGMSPSQLARMVLAEAALVAVVGSALGIGAGVVLFEAFRQLAPIMFGWPDPFAFDAGAAIQASVLVLMTSLVAAALPAWRAARLQVAEALQYE